MPARATKFPPVRAGIEREAIIMSTVRKYFGSLLLFLTLALSGAALTACDQDGPLEEAGESADEALSDAERAVKDAAD
jgi:hypothetical protein